MTDLSREDVEVTQADRDAAADYMWERAGDWGYCGDIRQGRLDRDKVVKAFARHRLAVLRSSSQTDAVRETIEQCAILAEQQFADPAWHDYYREASRAIAAAIRARPLPEPASPSAATQRMAKIMGAEFVRYDGNLQPASPVDGVVEAPYWLDEVLRRNGPCPTCGTLGMVGVVEDRAALTAHQSSDTGSVK